MNDPNDLGEVDIPNRDPLVVAQEMIERQRDWIGRGTTLLMYHACIKSCQANNVCQGCEVAKLLEPGWPWEYEPKRGGTDATTKEDPPADSRVVVS